MSIAALSHGGSGLLFAYGAVQAPLLAGLARGRAAFHHYLISPLAAAPLTVVAGLGIAAATPWLHAAGLGAGGAMQLFFGTAVCAGLGYAGGRTIAGAAGCAGAEDRAHRRGTVLCEAPYAAPARTAGRRAGAQDAPLRLAGIDVPARDEAKHFKLIGTTGTGKSTAIRELLGGALGRGDRAVIADPDGGYLHRFYDPQRGDAILNPFDARSVRWDLFAEIETAYDVEQLAHSLIPDHDGADRSWRGYARTFFTAVARQTQQAGIRSVGELYRLLVVAETDELKVLVQGTPAQPFLDEHNARMFDSVRSVTAAAVGALEHVAAQRAPAFSVRGWVRDDSPGVLFIPYKAGQIAALRSTISAWMRLGIFEAMNREEAAADAPRPRRRPLWFVVDELDALGQIDGLKDALARLRKFDARCVLGFQSIAQVSSTYGGGDAHTIVENCGNTLILRCSASEGGGTAKFASQLIGEREVLRTTTSTSRRASELLGTTTRGEHFSVEPALLPSQIEQLPDLVGYLKHASDGTWRRVQLAGMPPPAARQRRGGAAGFGHE
ncbi:MAG TPA: type IV secretion system DNA-binding domain-containing protein [Steroidobacteraceae bacterium]|nr:type IV secretion system DNA-binding domain-containing protein [Steroidobacteraceae bacterium]